MGSAGRELFADKSMARLQQLNLLRARARTQWPRSISHSHYICPAAFDLRAAGSAARWHRFAGERTAKRIGAISQAAILLLATVAAVKLRSRRVQITLRLRNARKMRP